MECIVIGAGLAGLAAADRLVHSGASVTLIEARDRLGGRLWTTTTASSQPIELGPEWIDKSSSIDRLLESHGVPPREAHGSFLRRSGGRLGLTAMRDEDETADLRKCVASLDQGDRSLIEALDQCSAGLQGQDARRLLLAYVQGFHAAEPALLSLQWFNEVETTQPAQASQCRLTEGLSRLIDILATNLGSRCRVLLNTSVGEVQWRRGAVDVITRDPIQRLTAERCITTVPLPMLMQPSSAAGSLRFSPELPDKRRAASRLQMGQVVKFVLQFRERFWEQEGALRSLLFAQDLEQPLPTWWASDPAGAATLTGWAGGPMATRLPGSVAQLRELALTSLAGTLGLSPTDIEHQLVTDYFHDWRSDPWAGGAYTYVAVGGRDAPRILAQPVENTLFFAGEATAGHGYNATMEGALTSGWRAAAEVLGEKSTIPQSR